MKMTIDLVPAKFRKYVGMRPPVADPMQRAYQMAFTLITECLAAPSTPFGRMARNALMLCDQTEPYIYGGTYGHIDQPYVRGSRPLLEQYVASIVKPGMTQTQQAIALSQSIADLPKRFGQTPAFLYGESDEQTLLKGGGHCSCRSRLLCALCQVLGMQARPVIFWVVPDPDPIDPKHDFVGGHTVAEVFADGGWRFLDPMLHAYCPKKTGGLASVLELRRDPTLLTGLDEQTVREMEPVNHSPVAGYSALRTFAHRYLQPVVPTCYSRHDVNSEQVGPWTWATQELRQQQAHDHKLYKRVLVEMARTGRLTDEVYAMGVEEFRRFAGITDAQMPVPKDVFTASPRSAASWPSRSPAAGCTSPAVPTA